MKMTLDMCVRRADELHMSYGYYMASKEHKEDAYDYGRRLKEEHQRAIARRYPGSWKMNAPELRETLEALRAKAKERNIRFDGKSVKDMTKQELKNQINAIWAKL